MKMTTTTSRRRPPEASGSWPQGAAGTAGPTCRRAVLNHQQRQAANGPAKREHQAKNPGAQKVVPSELILAGQNARITAATEKIAPTISARIFQPSTKAGAPRSAGSVLASVSVRFVSHAVASLFAAAAAGLLAGILIAGLPDTPAPCPACLTWHRRIGLHRGCRQCPGLRILRMPLASAMALSSCTWTPAGTSCAVAAWLNCNARM